MQALACADAQGIALDISPQALDDEARQFSSLLRGVTDYAIYMLDVDGYVRSWNPGGERIKGYASGDIIGQHFSRFYTPEDIAAGLPARGLSIARETGRFEAEGWRLRKDGTRFMASVVIDRIVEDGRLLGFAKITRDITERHQAQQALQAAQQALAESHKMEAIGRLTLGLAHDFNNLLTVVVNSFDMIARRAQADARTQDLVLTGLRAADRGSLLTRQLLAFARGLSLAAERADIDELLGRSLELYRRAAGDHVELEMRLSGGLPPVAVDIAQFEAAVLNLIANSRDAMARGGRIVVATERVQARDPSRPEDPLRAHVCVSVTDDGPGIAPQLQSRVFEPFFTTKEVGQGSGLGLSQVFGFAAQSQGFSDLSSTPGHGTTVRIWLPAEEAA